MKKQLKGKIIKIENIALNTYKLVFTCDLDEVKSGQFISILCPNKTLRRPFSVSDFDKENKLMTILFKLKGEGTASSRFPYILYFGRIEQHFSF